MNALNFSPPKKDPSVEYVSERDGHRHPTENCPRPLFLIQRLFPEKDILHETLHILGSYNIPGSRSSKPQNSTSMCSRVRWRWSHWHKLCSNKCKPLFPLFAPETRNGSRVLIALLYMYINVVTGNRCPVPCTELHRCRSE